MLYVVGTGYLIKPCKKMLYYSNFRSKRIRNKGTLSQKYTALCFLADSLPFAKYILMGKNIFLIITNNTGVRFVLLLLAITTRSERCLLHYVKSVKTILFGAVLFFLPELLKSLEWEFFLDQWLFFEGRQHSVLSIFSFF